MKSGINPFAAAPSLMQQFLEHSNEVASSGLEPELLELVKIRASQINKCSNCLNMHTYDARKSGETEQRIHLVAAWREAPVYSERERAALAWTEYLTMVAERPASDEIRATVQSQFSEEEQVQLTMAINNINGWNRLAIGLGLYEPSLGWQ